MGPSELCLAPLCHLLYGEEQRHCVVLELDVGRLGAGHLDLPHHEPACHDEDVHDVGGALDVEGVHVVVSVDDVGQGVDIKGFFESSGNEAAGGCLCPAFGRPLLFRTGSTSMLNFFS